MNPVRIADNAKLRGDGPRVDDRVLLREQNAVVVDSHISENVHGFLSDRATANDEGLNVSTVKLTHPSIAAVAKTTVLVNQRIM